MESFRISLGKIIVSLASSVQLASRSIGGHQERVAYMVWQMAKAAELSPQRIETSFAAALLHDIGALKPEEKIALHNSFDYEDVDSHCILGHSLLNNVPFFPEVAEIVRFHHTPWSYWKGSTGNPIVVESQLVNLADYVERLINRKQFILVQRDQIASRVKSLSGTEFFPAVVDLFLQVSEKEQFWLDIACPLLNSYLITKGPFAEKEIRINELAEIGNLFRYAIDFRSRFTATHSAGVGACASLLAKIFGFTEVEVQLMEFAGDIHDIGKMAISTYILEKPGKLTTEEMSYMKAHPYYTYVAFDSVENLRHVTLWAASHHENLDGSGYPFRLTSAELGLGSRIIKVSDVFTALTEQRPYRSGMGKDDALKIIEEERDKGHLDGNVVKKLLENYDDIYDYVSERQAIARELYERVCSAVDMV